MSSAVEEVRQPDPGSIAALFQPMLAKAAARGHCSAGVRLKEIPIRDSSRTPDYGPDVLVKIIYRDGTVDVVRLARAWTLFDAEVPVVSMVCPDDPRPAVFIAVAVVQDANGVLHVLGVVDLERGEVEALASMATMRYQVLRFANPKEKALAKKAKATINRTGDPSRQNGSDIFAAGAGMSLMEDPTKRGIDPGRPALVWWYKTVDTDGIETVIAASDPDFAPDPVAVLATAGVSELAVEAFGTTKPEYLGANVWHMPLTRKPRENENGQEQEEQEVNPSPVYLRVHRPVDIFDWTRAGRLHPDDSREWQDDTGDLGRDLADGAARLEVISAISLVSSAAVREPGAQFRQVFDSPAGQKRLEALRTAGLNDRESLVVLADEAGMGQRDIGTLIQRDKRTVRRVLAQAREKFEK